MTEPESVPEALEEGYEPKHQREPPEDGSWEEYAWGHISCPHCDTGMLVGVHDPEYVLEHDPARMAILAPGSDNTEQTKQ